MKELPITAVAAVIRSKNAGPFELTLDIMFKEEKNYLLLRKLKFFTKELFAELYGVSVEQILRVRLLRPGPGREMHHDSPAGFRRSRRH